MTTGSRQSGLTLIECLVAMALSSLVLAGMAHVLNVTSLSQATLQDSYQQRVAAETVMRRIAHAAWTATPKKVGDLVPKNASESGDWFYTRDSTGKTVIRRFSWNASTGILSETGDSGYPEALLDKVEHFSVTSVTPAAVTDATLVAITMTVTRGDMRFTTAETIRLGGAW